MLQDLRHKTTLRGAAVGVIGLTLAGCSLFKGPPPVTYNLATPPAAARLAGSTNAQILVPEATALETLNTIRVVVSTDGKLSYYPEVQLPDRLPKVLQDKIVSTLQVSKKVQAVGRPGEGLSIDYQLATNIRSFEFDTGTGQQIARVSIYAQLLDDRNGRAIATKLFNATAPVKVDNGDGVIAALDAALGKVLLDMAAWTLQAI